MSIVQEQQFDHSNHWSAEMLNVGRIKQLVSDIMPSEQVRAGRTMGLHVIEGSDVHADIGRYVEWQVFENAFGNDIDTMRSEYEPYDSASVFLTLVDYEKQQPAAVIRLIKPEGPKGLKSLNDLISPTLEQPDGTQIQNPWYEAGDTLESRLNEVGNDGSKIVDIGTMAVMPEYRSAHAQAGASAVLYSSCARWSFEQDYPFWVTIIDERALRMIQSWGEPFENFDHADYASYLDSSSSIPMHLDLYKCVPKIRAYDEVNGSDIFGLYTQGSGLKEQYVLPDFTLPDIG